MADNTQQTVPGADVLLDTLRRSKLNDDQRQQIWDAYHTPGDQKAFVKGLNSLDVDDDVKQTIYDMRWNGFKNPPTKNAPSSTQAPQAQSPVPTASPNLGMAGWWDKLQGTIYPTALAKTEDVLSHPLYAHFGQKSLSELLKERWEGIPVASGGVTGAALDTVRLGSQTIAGVFDFATAPKGIASAVVAATGPTSAAAVGSAFTSDAYGGARDAYINYKQNPNPENLQKMLFSFSQVPALAAGAVEGTKASVGETHPVGSKEAVQQTASKLPTQPTPTSQPATPQTNTPPLEQRTGQLALDFNARPTEQVPTKLKDVEVVKSTETSQTVKPQVELPKLTPEQNDTVNDVISRIQDKQANARTPQPTQNLITENGFVDKGELVPGSGVFQYEHPDHFGQTVAINANKEAITPELLRNKLADKLQDNLDSLKAGKDLKPVDNDIYRSSFDATKMADNISKLRGKEAEVAQPVTQAPIAEAEPAKPVPTQSGPVATPELPNWLKNEMGRLPEVQRLAAATNELSPERKSAVGNLSKLKRNVNDGILNFISKLGMREANSFGKDMRDRASRFDAQASEVQRIIDSHPIAEAIREEMASGTPAKSPAGGVTIIGSTHADMRTMLHDALGDKTQTKFDEIAINQRAKMREKGIDPDAGVEADRRAILEQSKKELAELQAYGKKRLTELTESYLEKNPSRVQEIGEDEAAAEAKKAATSQLLSEKLANGKTMRERVADLRGIIGREAQREVYASKGKAVIDNGVVKHPGDIPEKTLDVAQKIWGRKLNKIPDADQWTAKVAEFRSMAELHRFIADRADKRIQDIKAGFKGQEGFATITGKPLTEAAVAVPKPDDLAKRASKLHYAVRQVSAETPGFNRAWLSPDGKTSIEVPLEEEHDSVAHRILGLKSATPDWENAPSADGTDAMLKAGWIRKANYNSYQAQRLTPSLVNSIEHDAITNGRFSKVMTLEHITADGKFQSFDIEPGWDDLKSEVAKSLRQHDRYEIGDESGFATLKQMATTGAAASGAAIGYQVGGVQGAIIGGGVGAAVALGLPKTLRVPALFRQSLSRIAPMLSNTGITLRDWYMGTPQRPVDSDMQGIIEKQSSSLRGGPTVNLLSRMGKLPGTVLQNFDPLLFVNDRLGPVVSRLLSADPRGKEFRDLNGKLTIDDSPYVAAVNAIGGGSGAGEIHLLSYKGIFGEAEKAGSLNELYKYLNLKGYQRVWNVLSDRLWKFDSDINNLQQQLFAGGFKDARERIAVEDQLAEANKGKRDLQDQMAQGKVTPNNYDPSKIHTSLQDMQNNMSPADYSKVEAWGKRVFQLNRKVLDLVHTAGIVSDNDYQTYTQRGDEYVPMHRILENMAENEFQAHGSSPLYLKQQNVINALRGSQKVNVNPIIASADANLEALKEVARNNVVKSFLDTAQQDPNGVGKLFKAVPTGYKPKAGEATVGHYEQGKVQYYVTPDWLGSTLQHGSPIAAEAGVGAMQRWFKSTLQGTATAGNLAWSLPNAVRHLGDMIIQSKGGVKVGPEMPKDLMMLSKTWVSSLKDTVQKNPAWQEYVSSGAAYSTLQRQLTPERELDPNQIGAAPNWRTRVLDSVRTFNQAIEDTTKLTTFTRLRQMGYTEKAAAFETRRYGGGPDFARMGNASSTINQYAMFFNAHIQYVSRTFSRLAEDPKRIGAWLGAASVMALTLNQYNWQFKLPNGQPSMQAVPHSDRENNFIVLTGGTYVTENGSRVPNYYRIPKPSVLKFLYNPIEQVVNGLAKNETRSGTQRTLDTLSAYVPGQLHVDENDKAKSLGSSVLANLNPMFSVPLEQSMNFQAYNERPIVPNRLQGVEPSQQFTPTTPSVYKEMGQGGLTGTVAGATLGGSLGFAVGGTRGALVGGGVGAVVGASGISPLRTEQVVRGTTAGVGQGIASIGDALSGGRNFPFQGQQATRQIPGAGTIAGRFISTPINQSDRDSENRFYQQLDTASTIQKTYQQMSKSQPDVAAAYLQKNLGAYRAAVVGQEMKLKIGELNSAIVRTQQNTTMSDEDKIKALESLHKVKMNLIDSFNGVIRGLMTGGRKNPEPAGPPQGGSGWSR